MADRRSFHSQSMMAAYCGMTAALSAVLMLTGTLIPIMTYAAPLLCGLFLLPVMLEFGKKAAWLTWAAAALVVLLLGADREAAFFYLCLGYYPILHWEIEKLKKPVLRLIAKLGFFSVSMGMMYWVLMILLHMDAIAAEFAEMGTVLTILFFLCMLAVLMLYDRLLWPMCLLYGNRIKPHLKFLHRSR